MKKNNEEGAKLEALDTKVSNIEVVTDRLQADVAVLKTDMVEVKVAVKRLEVDVAQLRTGMVEGFEQAQVQLDTLKDELTERIDDLSLNQRTLTAAVVEAVTQLNLSRTYEKRLVRLEEKVFGSGGT
jgi:chromosome segregation ATPase